MKTTSYNAYQFKLDKNKGIFTKNFPLHRYSSWETEVSTYQLLAKLNFSYVPKMLNYGSGKASHFIELEYISSNDLHLTLEEKVKLVGTTLKDFHSLKLENASFPILNNLKFYNSTFSSAVSLISSMKEDLVRWGLTPNRINELYSLTATITNGEKNQDIVHRDIRFDNFIFFKDHAYLIDFENVALGNKSFDVSRFIWRELKNQNDLERLFFYHYNQSQGISDSTHQSNKTLFAIEMLNYFHKNPSVAKESPNYILDMINHLNTAIF